MRTPSTMYNKDFQIGFRPTPSQMPWLEYLYTVGELIEHLLNPFPLPISSFHLTGVPIFPPFLLSTPTRSGNFILFHQTPIKLTNQRVPKIHLTIHMYHMWHTFMKIIIVSTMQVIFTLNCWEMTGERNPEVIHRWGRWRDAHHSICQLSTKGIIMRASDKGE